MLDVSAVYEPAPRRPPPRSQIIDLVIAPRFLVESIAEYLACEPPEPPLDYDAEYE
jgi:hypothetical protein